MEPNVAPENLKRDLEQDLCLGKETKPKSSHALRNTLLAVAATASAAYIGASVVWNAVESRYVGVAAPTTTPAIDANADSLNKLLGIEIDPMASNIGYKLGRGIQVPYLKLPGMDISLLSHPDFVRAHYNFTPRVTLKDGTVLEYFEVIGFASELVNDIEKEYRGFEPENTQTADFDQWSADIDKTRETLTHIESYGYGIDHLEGLLLVMQNSLGRFITKEGYDLNATSEAITNNVGLRFSDPDLVDAFLYERLPSGYQSLQKSEEMLKLVYSKLPTDESQDVENLDLFSLFYRISVLLKKSMADQSESVQSESVTSMKEEVAIRAIKAEKFVTGILLLESAEQFEEDILPLILQPGEDLIDSRWLAENGQAVIIHLAALYTSDKHEDAKALRRYGVVEFNDYISRQYYNSLSERVLYLEDARSCKPSNLYYCLSGDYEAIKARLGPQAAYNYVLGVAARRWEEIPDSDKPHTLTLLGSAAYSIDQERLANYYHSSSAILIDRLDKQRTNR